MTNGSIGSATVIIRLKIENSRINGFGSATSQLTHVSVVEVPKGRLLDMIHFLGGLALDIIGH